MDSANLNPTDYQKQKFVLQMCPLNTNCILLVKYIKTINSLHFKIKCMNTSFFASNSKPKQLSP